MLPVKGDIRWKLSWGGMRFNRIGYRHKPLQVHRTDLLVGEINKLNLIKLYAYRI